MSEPMDRRTFAAGFAASVVLGREAFGAEPLPVAPMPHAKPTEAAFERDYPPPPFNPRWLKPQLNKLMVQDFVMFGHFDLKMVEKLLAKEPMLVNAFMDWGGGDWESALGGASHIGNREIATFLLKKGARIDIFCAAMLGQLEVVKGLLTAVPELIDAKGPHGISLHMHAKMGGKDAEKTLDYLQSVKKVEFPAPKKDDKKDPPKKND